MRNASNAILSSVERALQSKMEIVRGLLHYEDNELEFELSEVVSGEYSIPGSGHYYQVVIDGNVFASSMSLVNPEFEFTMPGEFLYDEWGVMYSSLGPENERVRVMRSDFMFLSKYTTIIIAESIEDSISIINTIRMYVIAILSFTIFIACFMNLWIFSRSLRPLDYFSDTVSRITHKNLEERLDTHSQAAELRVLSESFNGMLDRLQKAFEIERQVIADASHELKTPLSVVKAQCDVILLRRRTVQEYTEAFEIINRAASTMGRLVNDLLLLAKLDSGILSLKSFSSLSINECLQDAIRMVRVLAEKKDITLVYKVQGELYASGSKAKLSEAFMNILDNAVLYSDIRGVVEATAHRENNKIVVRIRDEGVGIDKADLQRIFDRFYRVDKSRSSKGTGLGLSIANVIIESHGGSIVVESVLGEGSIFTVSIPVSM
ncbi:MAG: HAMP domain-containing histidine kinase [Nitrospira sp.]|nr:HAMP domain-containing histidine kinase [Nitrospira sp.]